MARQVRVYKVTGRNKGDGLIAAKFRVAADSVVHAQLIAQNWMRRPPTQHIEFNLADVKSTDDTIVVGTPEVGDVS